MRGPSGQPAGFVLDQVTDEQRYRFDQAARVFAIETAGKLYNGDPDMKLSINSCRMRSTSQMHASKNH